MRDRPLTDLFVTTFIEQAEEAYLLSLLGDTSADNRENGLERFCKHCRAGRRPRQKAKFITLLTGLLHDEVLSVRRWALNALALAGSRLQLPAIRHAIADNRNELDVFGAGISALAALTDHEEAQAILRSMDIPLEGGPLFAASQQSNDFRKELKKNRIHLDRIADADLRLAMLLVGLGKAPENFFDGNFKNRQVIGTLNRHPDRLVAQYSVWATYENPTYSLKHLGIPLNRVEEQRPNVRKYIYRLVTSRATDARKHYEFLIQGSQDGSVEVRLGLAEGIRDLHFDAIDTLALDWFADEEDLGVRRALLEHMALNLEALPNYREPVLISYEQAARGSLLRNRLEAAAQGTSLFRQLKVIALDQEQKSLFDENDMNPIQSGKEHAKMVKHREFKPKADSELAAQARVLVVAALPKEQAAVAATLTASHQSFSAAGDSNLYQLGLVQPEGQGDQLRPVLITSSGMGTENAATLAANALRSFPEVRHILMVGIAGGCPNLSKADEHIRLGDVVVSSHRGIIAYDHIKETNEAEEIRGTAQEPSAQMLSVQRALESGAYRGYKPWVRIISSNSGQLIDYDRPSDELDVLKINGVQVEHPVQKRRTTGEPMIHSGVIGSSNTLQKNAATRDMLRDKFGVRAIEMEASGLQKAAWAQGKDVFVIRGICDYCDENKNDDWQNYAALAAAGYARAMIESMPREWFPTCD